MLIRELVRRRPSAPSDRIEFPPIATENINWFVNENAAKDIMSDSCVNGHTDRRKNYVKHLATINKHVSLASAQRIRTIAIEFAQLFKHRAPLFTFVAKINHFHRITYGHAPARRFRFSRGKTRRRLRAENETQRPGQMGEITEFKRLYVT